MKRLAAITLAILFMSTVTVGQVVPTFPYDPNLVNYEILDAVTVGSTPVYTQGGTVLFNVLDPNTIKYEFKVYTRGDVPISAVSLSGNVNLVVVRTNKERDPYGWVNTYYLTFDATTAKVYYVDIKVTDASSTELPLLRRSQLISWVWPERVFANHKLMKPRQKSWQAGMKQGLSQMKTANVKASDLEKRDS
jgi:hypothetical protein